ncbi:hypothetical protein B0H14DRAFT_2658859 [Mycena olivaceomarginata]|nr:hypothetical protein B0H14DRAFT_2658859 [Mycena olivaceomarginata]
MLRSSSSSCPVIICSAASFLAAAKDDHPRHHRHWLTTNPAFNSDSERTSTRHLELNQSEFKKGQTIRAKRAGPGKSDRATGGVDSPAELWVGEYSVLRRLGREIVTERAAEPSESG